MSDSSLRTPRHMSLYSRSQSIAYQLRSDCPEEKKILYEGIRDGNDKKMTGKLPSYRF